jgi:TctA family transporter
MRGFIVDPGFRFAASGLQGRDHQAGSPAGATGETAMGAEMGAAALQALQLLFEPARLTILLTGVLIGLAIGALPGLGGIVGLAMLLPFTYSMDPYTAFALLLGMSAVTSSSDFIPAVLFGVPGTVGAAATVIDGHAMARNGEAGRALGAGLAASLLGGLLGAVVLAVSIPILRPVMLAIGIPELLAFTIFGLSMVATLSGRAPLKGLAVAGFGLMLAMIGPGGNTGALRWTFGSLYLWEGLPLVPVALGLFAIPELAELAITRMKIARQGGIEVSVQSQWVGVRDTLKHWTLVVRCGLIGTWLGAVPGIGSSVIDWIALGYAHRTLKNPETLGTGDVRGVIAPESANNAKEGGDLIPTIAFGVPGGASMAILLGAFLMHGLVPGPEMLGKNLDLTYLIVWSLVLAQVVAAGICLAGSRWIAKIAEIRAEILLPVVLPLVFVAAYQGSHDWGDLFALLAFGLLGWFMKFLHWPRPPLILGLVIGEIFERYLFIANQLYGWAWLVRPLVLAMFVVILWSLYRPMATMVRSVAADFRRSGSLRPRLPPASLFTLALIATILFAFATSLDWPWVAKIVPYTAGAAALLAAVLNFGFEIFGKAEAAVEPDNPLSRAARGPAPERPPQLVLNRAAGYFLWLVGLIVLIWLIGFLPAICVFVAAYMAFGFGEPIARSLAFGGTLAVLCWLVFEYGLRVPWPASVIGDLVPAIRAATGFL